MSETNATEGEGEQHSSVDAADRFLALLLVFEVLLVAFTWPLWFTIDRFPAIPLLSAFGNVPAIVDQCLTIVMCIAGGMAALRFRKGTVGRNGTPPNLLMWTSVVCGVLLVLLNQHRLQPWHWLFLLLVLQALLLPRPSWLAMFRLSLAAIYIYAAASRWGPDVDTGMSRQVLAVVVNSIGNQHLMHNSTFVFVVCSIMSAVEFLTGICLLIPKLQRFGLLSSVVIHATLIFALSPFGLNHHLAVIVWNAFLLLAVVFLFSTRPAMSPLTEARSGPALAKLFTGFVVIFPLTAYWGWADNWPSWQVYSPRPEVVRVHIHEAAVSELSPELSQFLGSPAALSEWYPFRIDRWALATVSVPLYPEDRFQLAVAAQLRSCFSDPSSLQIGMLGSNRQAQLKARVGTFDGEKLAVQLQSFFFNATVERRGEWRSRKAASLSGITDE